MLLAFLLLPCFFRCGSSSTQYELCYGGIFRFPFDYSPPGFTGKLYFTPKNGEGRRLVFENGKAVDPRLKVTFASLSLEHVTEKDNGYFSVPFGSMFLNRISLKVSECADEVQRYYHGWYRVDIPSLAEILEFFKIDNSDAVILWNRSDTQTSAASRGRVKENAWDMSELTQDDNGYYNFRKKDYTLLWRKKLTVTEHTNEYQPKEESLLFMRYPLKFTPWDMTFIPSGDDSDSIKVIRSGRLSRKDENFFKQRISLESDGIEITPVKVEDSGTYKFRDKDGHLVFMTNVAVEEVHAPAYVYVIVFVAIVAVVALCCCCIRRCCCKKTASKTNPPQRTREAAPGPVQLVHYHDSNQPTGPSCSAAPPAVTYSYQPVNPVVPREPSPAPASASFGPPAYNRVDIHPDPTPTQFEAAVSTGHEVAPPPSLVFDCPPSDPGPRFELKGLRFPSDPPLSSEPTFASVYTSDKLNL
ncbi:uncharacterized protein LOC133484611 [Phyllopteryx taeniolatus]|uniref:uncharacterized protein LOC133484611 n=1 Tax=Phyllopteryx taeniolatus TaxID=161469 RepID=UPI002AD2EBAE|nr:uncharacterized protein LOC133484611 [Phyllopteryx taeniolatus]